eukprot:263114-Chlamydomonas_euryale.AAC.2
MRRPAVCPPPATSAALRMPSSAASKAAGASPRAYVGPPTPVTRSAGSSMIGLRGHPSRLSVDRCGGAHAGSALAICRASPRDDPTSSASLPSRSPRPYVRRRR